MFDFLLSSVHFYTQLYNLSSPSPWILLMSSIKTFRVIVFGTSKIIQQLCTFLLVMLELTSVHLHCLSTALIEPGLSSPQYELQMLQSMFPKCMSKVEFLCKDSCNKRTEKKKSEWKACLLYWGYFKQVVICKILVFFSRGFHRYTERKEGELTDSWLAALPIDPHPVCLCVCVWHSLRYNWHREYLCSPLGVCVYICILFPRLYSL